MPNFYVKTLNQEEIFLMPNYSGGAFFSEGKFRKVHYDDIADEDLSSQATNGWLAFVDHHFFGALIPPKDQVFDYYSRYLGDQTYLLGAIDKSFYLRQGEQAAQTVSFYVGPKDHNQIMQVGDRAENLEATKDYGWLSFLAKPLFLLLNFVFELVGSWPLAIIIVTLLIKTAFFPLAKKSYRAMAKMRQLAPRMQKIKERVGDDRQKLQQEMMALYRNEKINPASGCLPILLQIPFFIAFYWVLLESVEMRGSAFLWIDDITLKDPFFILPILMAVSMFVMQKLNPKPADPIQAKVMMFMPIMFSALFFFFPAGLVLYWLVNNLFSIVQQWLINRSLETKK